MKENEMNDSIVTVEAAQVVAQPQSSNPIAVLDKESLAFIAKVAGLPTGLMEAVKIASQGDNPISNAALAFAFGAVLEACQMLPRGSNARQAAGAIIAGARYGLDPFTSTQKVAMVNGRPALWGDAVPAVVYKTGLVEWVENTWISSDGKEFPHEISAAFAARYTVKRRDQEKPYTRAFTAAMAQQAGLWGKPGPWAQYPQVMLMTRARTYALREAFPEVLSGLYTDDEVAHFTDTPVRKSTAAPTSAQEKLAARLKERTSAIEEAKTVGETPVEENA